MTRRIDCSDYDVLYSKLLRLFRIDYMFTSLRLRVIWRTEQLIIIIT